MKFLVKKRFEIKKNIIPLLLHDSRQTSQREQKRVVVQLLTLLYGLKILLFCATCFVCPREEAEKINFLINLKKRLTNPW